MKDSYRIDVKDFGPIASASVDFRPLTVFVGPSNTGKSYLAVLLYALHRCLGGLDADFHGLGIRRRMPVAFKFSIPDLTEFMRTLEDLIMNSEPPYVLPGNIAEVIRSIMEKADGLDEHLTNEIRRCFGIDSLDALIRRQSSSRRGIVTLCVLQENEPNTLRYQIELSSRKARFSANIPSLESLLPEGKLPMRLSAHLLQNDALLDDLDDPNLSEFIFRSQFGHFLSSLFHFLTGPAGRNAFYLPAGRTGVMHNHQVVVSALVQNASAAGSQLSTNGSVLSGVLADFLSLLIRIGSERQFGRRSAPHGKSAELGRGLEDNLLSGAVLLKSTDAGYPTFAYRPEGWKDDMPLMRASSMVSELAPVVLYLRHIVRPGDVLIIEEPEAHLHPAMQAAFARELARLVRAGVRIVMTTHSEWFLEQIGNLVRLSGLPKAKRKGLEGTDYALEPDQVGAWLFKPSNRPKGSVVEEVALDPETGLYPAGYDAVSEALYNEGADIYNRIQESKQK